jgi:HEAT repeat protein
LVEVFLDDEDSTVRHFARQALSERGGAAVISALLEALEAYEDDPAVLIDTLEVLAQLRTKRAKSAFEQLTTHPDEGVKATATWALGLLK